MPGVMPNFFRLVKGISKRLPSLAPSPDMKLTCSKLSMQFLNYASLQKNVDCSNCEPTKVTTKRLDSEKLKCLTTKRSHYSTNVDCGASFLVKSSPDLKCPH